MSRINTWVAEVGCMFIGLVVVQAAAAASNTICRLSKGMSVCMLRRYPLTSHLLGKYSVWWQIQQSLRIYSNATVSFR